MNNIEDLVMAHRYLYYVLANPTLLDWQYDIIEREARKLLPKESPVQGIGSDLSSSYSKVQKEIAEHLLNWREE